MTAYDNVGSRRPQRNQGGLLWGLGGLVIGIGIGLAGPRVWHRLRSAPAKPVAVAAKPRPKPGVTVQIAAQPTQRGLLITSTEPVKMLKSSETGRAKQQGRAMFTGFKNWDGTTNYLTSGEGDLMIKASNGTTIKWTRPDYKALLEKKPLTAKLTPSRYYTLVFQRRGRRSVDLGTFSTDADASLPDAPASSGDASDETASDEPTPDVAIDLEAPKDGDAPGDIKDTSELDVEDIPADDAPPADGNRP